MSFMDRYNRYGREAFGWEWEVDDAGNEYGLQGGEYIPDDLERGASDIETEALVPFEPTSAQTGMVSALAPPPTAVRGCRERFSGEGDFDIARGDTLLDDGEEAALTSPVEGASDEAWTQFVRRMITAAPGDVSPSNAVGMFEMTSVRLCDLGLVKKLARKKSPRGKTVWTAAFVPPLTPERFLKDSQLQYKVFCRSVRDYAEKIEKGEIAKDDKMSLSGALAILQKAGPKGLESWAAGDRFPNTEAVYERTAGLF